MLEEVIGFYRRQPHSGDRLRGGRAELFNDCLYSNQSSTAGAVRPGELSVALKQKRFHGGPLKMLWWHAKKEKKTQAMTAFQEFFDVVGFR